MQKLKINERIAVFRVVDGASCITVSTCQSTDFTLSTCASDVCNCINSSYTPVRTGCALKLNKPVIAANPRRSNQVTVNSIFDLTCKVDEAQHYEWYKDDVVLPTKVGNTYSDVAISTTVGSFKCKGVTADGEVKSEMSDAFTLVLLGTGGISTSDLKPIVIVPTQSIVSGQSVTLDCSNIPMGYLPFNIKYK
ncbi:hypothetical protein Btru_061312, partial [Bulinus truncatus]